MSVTNNKTATKNAGSKRTKNSFHKAILIDKSEWPKPDLTLFYGAASAPPKLQLDKLGTLGQCLESIAAAKILPADYYLTSALTSVGALVGKMYQAELAAGYPTWLFMWAVNVGAPGSGKTPAIRDVGKHLAKLQYDMQDRYRDKIDAEIAQLRDSEADEDKRRVRELEEDRKRPPQYLVNDTTQEEMAYIEAKSTRGVSVWIDELSGFVRNFYRYKSDGKAYYTSAFEGDAWTANRRNADPLTIHVHGVGMMGSMQPDVIEECILDGADDGFAGRFVFAWPNTIKSDRETCRPNLRPLYEALDKIAALSGGSNGEPFVFQPNAAAKKAFHNWMVHTHTPRLHRHERDGKLATAFSKMPSHLTRIAGSLHILHWAFSDVGTDAPPEHIDLDTIKQAIWLIENYFVLQARRVFSSMSRAEAMASDLINALLDHNEFVFNGRNAIREHKPRGYRGDDAPYTRKRMFELLIEAELIRGIKVEGSCQHAFQINPHLADWHYANAPMKPNR